MDGFLVAMVIVTAVILLTTVWSYEAMVRDLRAEIAHLTDELDYAVEFLATDAEIDEAVKRHPSSQPLWNEQW
jgi:hypothetical protein